MNPTYIYRANGSYLGFIQDGFLFSRDGEFLGRVDNGFVWDRSGQFRGQIWGERYIIRDSFALPPVPRGPIIAPAKPSPLPQQQLITPIGLPFGQLDAF